MKIFLLTIFLISASHKTFSQQELICTQPPRAQLVTRSVKKISIRNSITPDMITFKQHWSGHHIPKIWTLRINGKELHKNERMNLSIKKNIIKIVFYFEFWVLNKPYRKGSIEIHYDGLTDGAHYTVEFCWDNPERILLIMHTDNKRIVLKPIYVAEQKIK